LLLLLVITVKCKVLL